MVFKKGDKVFQRGPGPFPETQFRIGKVVNKTWIGCWSYQVKYGRATREFHNGELSKHYEPDHLTQICRSVDKAYWQMP